MWPRNLEFVGMIGSPFRGEIRFVAGPEDNIVLGFKLSSGQMLPCPSQLALSGLRFLICQMGIKVPTS